MIKKCSICYSDNIEELKLAVNTDNPAVCRIIHLRNFDASKILYCKECGHIFVDLRKE